MRMSRPREFAMIAVVAGILAAPISWFMMYAAWEHNPQGAIHEVAAGGGTLIHWRYWLLVGATWFVPVFVSVCALGAFLRAAITASHRDAV
jgi:hypothetical protein